MTVESKATRKLTIAPTENKTARPIYQDLYLGHDEDKVMFKNNPKGFNLDRAKKNPLFTGKVENYRQGDVLLERIDKLPEGLKNLNTTVLAESHLTKNTHEFLYGNVEVLGKDDDSAEVYVNVIGDVAVLGHNESQTDRIAHKAHIVQPGVYQLKFQQTFFDNRPIRVID